MADRTQLLEKADTTTRIAVSNRIVSRLDIGVGWNDSSCLDGRWPESRAAGFGAYRGPFKRKFSKNDWDNYFGLLDWSGCHWLRHAISISDWKPSNENVLRNRTARPTFVFNSKKMRQHYLVLDQAEKRGMKVLLANWNKGVGRSNRRGTEYDHPENEDLFAESLAALIYHLKRERKYECVWALSLWNEPDNRRGYTGPGADYPDSFWPLYKLVEYHLSCLGIRDEILLLGPDTTTGGRPQHIAKMLEAHGPILDVVADHDYAAFRGKTMFRSVVTYEWLMQNLRDIYSGRVPFVITEFGNYGSGPGSVNDDRQVYDGALSTTAYIIQMINNGVSGLARWEFSIYGDEWRNFGALTNSDKAYLFRPYGPVYYPHAITARYIKPGWEVREVLVKNDGEALFVSALTSNQGDLTLIMLNDDTISRLAGLSLDLHFSIEQLHHLMVTETFSDGIIRCDEVSIGKNGIHLTLPPKSITVLTTLPPGNLTLPIELSLKRTGRDEFYNMLNRQLHYLHRGAGKIIRSFGG